MYGSKGGMAFSYKGSSVSQVWRRGRGRSGGRGGRGVLWGKEGWEPSAFSDILHLQVSSTYGNLSPLNAYAYQ